MFILSLNTIISICLLLVINFALSKRKILIDKPDFAHHKFKHNDVIPLSGGIYFFLSLIYLSNFNNFEIKILIFLLPFLLIGLLADIRKEFSPKLRLIFQIFFFFIIVYFNEIKISSIDLVFFDKFLENKLFNFFFVIFCLVTILNGHNFMDGLNGLVVGNFILILLSIYYIDLQLHEDLSQLTVILQNLIIISIVFFLFNILGKCFLGDNGIYIFSIFISLVIILFIEKSQGLVSPLLAATFLWYAAFENLFSILRRIKKKKTVYVADKLHLHSLVINFLFLKFRKKFSFQKINTLSALLINLCLLPNFILGITWYNNSTKLAVLISVQILIYLFLYSKLSRLKN